MRDFTTKVDNDPSPLAGQLGAAEWNELASELEHLITFAGLTLSNGDLTQIRQAVQAIAGTTFAPLDEETGTSYAPDANDVGAWKEMNNGSPITVTLNTGIFAAGDEIIFEQTGAGTVTFAAGGGFTLNSRGAALDIAGQYGVAVVKFKSATEAVLSGDITT